MVAVVVVDVGVEVVVVAVVALVLALAVATATATAVALLQVCTGPTVVSILHSACRAGVNLGLNLGQALLANSRIVILTMAAPGK